MVCMQVRFGRNRVATRILILRASIRSSRESRYVTTSLRNQVNVYAGQHESSPCGPKPPRIRVRDESSQGVAGPGQRRSDRSRIGGI